MLGEHVEQQPITDPLLTGLTISTSEVVEILRNLDTNKAAGPDEIPARILKKTAEKIAASLAEFCNKSLLLETLPEEWKLANVVPVYKKEKKEHVENYRPVSLLSVVSKVMERCVFNAIKYAVLSIISPYQHSFIAHN